MPGPWISSGGRRDVVADLCDYGQPLLNKMLGRGKDRGRLAS
jgi:hypothetical protein